MYRPLRLAQFRVYRTYPALSRWAATKGDPASRTAPLIETVRTVFENSFVHLHAPLSAQAREDLRQHRFTFLNQTRALPTIDWNHRYESHLWNYHFHYFGYVLACARELAEHGEAEPMRHCQPLIESWMATAKIGRSDGWEAYPISLRVVHWIYAYALIAERYDDEAFLQRWRASIYAQLEFLRQHLEYHLLANHLLKNAKALVVGGLFFVDDARGQEWLATGERLLWREFEEQVLEDGGHYERTPMYHALCLADWLECFALLRAFKTERGIEWDAMSTTAILAKLRAMTRFLATLSYADGTLALFNDSANCAEARPLPLLETARRILGAEREGYAPVFPETGYYAWISPDETERIIVDAGPTAVEYNQAHAHCDLLSYELRLAGKPFIVDSGVHGYGGDRFRNYCRSTRAHNTVMFDGREQSEIWGTFRIGRTAELLHVEVNSDERTWDFRGAYRPYYDRNLIHERRVQRTAQGEWIITDTVHGTLPQRAQSFIHLHPEVDANITAAARVECRSGQTNVGIEANNADRVEIIEAAEAPIQGWYFPDFGVAQPSKTICFEHTLQEGRSFGYSIKQES